MISTFNISNNSFDNPQSNVGGGGVGMIGIGGGSISTVGGGGIGTVGVGGIGGATPINNINNI